MLKFLQSLMRMLLIEVRNLQSYPSKCYFLFYKKRKKKSLFLKLKKKNQNHKLIKKKKNLTGKKSALNSR